MELQEILERYAEAIETIDAEADPNEVRTNRRTGEVYFPGFASMNEEPAVAAIDLTWSRLHPDELIEHTTGVNYPELRSTAKADHVFTTDDPSDDAPEWAIEIKRLQFAGNNGKRNDYAVTKVLSPYLKDRGMLHDVMRLKQYGFSRRIAVVGYGFEYDSESIAEGRSRFEGTAERAVFDELEKTLKSGPLRFRPLVDFADAIIRLSSLTSGPRAETTFDAWTHPAGGHGILFGWEVRRPEREVDYDPRHPW